jgi:uncharacterized membrane protein
VPPWSYHQMAFVGRLHPLLIHFPIALVIAAATAEGAAALTGNEGWRTMAVRNIRIGALLAAFAAAAGWRLALAPGNDSSALLAWHRWVGTTAAVATVAAALATPRAGSRAVPHRWMYQIALFTAAALVAVTGHLGGLLVWGADFLRP